MGRLARDCGGAAAVEFGGVLGVLVVLSLGIIDFSLLMFDFARATEATRRGNRLAAVSDPVGNLDGLSTNEVVCTSSGGTASCTNGAVINAAVFDAVLAEMQAIYPDLLPANVVITYSASGIGAAESGGYKPYVKVSLKDFQRPFYALQAVVGVAPTIRMPSFATVRLGNNYQPLT